MSATKIIHSIPSDPLTGAISVPVYQTSTFIQEAPGVNRGFDYARSNNPTRKVLEDVIAELEEGHGGFAFATGLAAIDSVLKLLSAGDEIVAVDDIYGGAYRLFTHVYEKLGISVKYVDATEVDNIAHAVTSKTKLIWLESPTNPTLKISDIKAISKIAKSVVGKFLVAHVDDAALRTIMVLIVMAWFLEQNSLTLLVLIVYVNVPISLWSTDIPSVPPVNALSME